MLILSALLGGRGASSQELTSSLFSAGGVEEFADPFAVQPVAPTLGVQTDQRSLSPAIAALSFTAVTAPEPRTFAVHDLITIVIREDMQTDFSSSLETEKSVEYTGEIAEFPKFQVDDLLQFTLVPNTFPEGTVKLDVSGDSEFEGEGDYSNQQTMTGRVEARIIDVKPNGNVVLEARKTIRSDKEEYTLVGTGTCRVDDITADNTILSSQLAGLYIDKQHVGYLKKAADKGLFTQIMDTLFHW